MLIVKNVLVPAGTQFSKVSTIFKPFKLRFSLILLNLQNFLIHTRIKRVSHSLTAVFVLNVKQFCLMFTYNQVPSTFIILFLGPYESGPSTTYKHFYFNATVNTAKIWILTVICIVVNYECVKYLTRLTLSKSIRYSMLFLFCIVAFTHYYAWWMYVMYYNDEFYSQWTHQTFFTVNSFKTNFYCYFTSYLTLHFTFFFLLRLPN